MVMVDGQESTEKATRTTKAPPDQLESALIAFGMSFDAGAFDHCDRVQPSQRKLNSPGTETTVAPWSYATPSSMNIAVPDAVDPSRVHESI